MAETMREASGARGFCCCTWQALVVHDCIVVRAAHGIVSVWLAHCDSCVDFGAASCGIYVHCRCCACFVGCQSPGSLHATDQLAEITLHTTQPTLCLKGSMCAQRSLSSVQYCNCFTPSCWHAITIQHHGMCGHKAGAEGQYTNTSRVSQPVSRTLIL